MRLLLAACVLCALGTGLLPGVAAKKKEFVPLSEVRADAMARKEPLHVVQLGNGPVRGFVTKTNKGRTIYNFLGIPYARPPVGKHRFKEPKPVKPWQGVWDGTRYGARCLHFERTPTEKMMGDEDCLFVNVFTPQLPELGKALMDVVVYIHGGGFMYGSGDPFGPEILLDKDIVFVTFNYRLGPLGFLSTEDEVVPGNMGLKDQSMALRWVQGNIAAFGGNPNSVTLGGLSAGGASVHYHYLSPLSKGLFHRGWSFSGSALNPWTQAEASLEKANKMGALLGCPTNSTRELVDCLRSRPARAIVDRVRDFQDHMQLPFSPFAPVVEPAGTMSAFLDTPPIDVIQSGSAHDLPWVVGVTTEEGLYPVAEFVNSKLHFIFLEMRWPEVAPLLMDYNYTAPDRDTITDKIREAYMGKAILSPDTAKGLIDMAGDRLFKTGVEQAAREMAAVNKQPVYLYEFGYRGKYSYGTFMAQDDPTDWGVSHADDVPFVVDWELMPTDETAEDQAVSDLMLNFWTTYTRTGVPAGPPGSPGWASLDPKASDLHVMKVGRDGKLSLAGMRQLGKTDFWLSLPLQENVPAANRGTGLHEEL